MWIRFDIHAVHTLHTRAHLHAGACQQRRVVGNAEIGGSQAAASIQHSHSGDGFVGTGSGTQEVVVTNRVYPRYVGALVVCEGGGSAGVRLAVTQAVSALTALPSDKITVLQGKP